jgi:hypothetical protein
VIRVRLEGFPKIVKFLDQASQGIQPTKKAVNALLQTETMEAWVRAYSGWPEFSREGLADVLASLLRKVPTAETPMLKILESGFRRALVRLDALRENYDRCREIDFAAAESKALAFLPPGAELTARVHFTVDAFNGGFFHENDVFFSLLDLHEAFFGVDAFAHEFHHIGVRTLTRNHALTRRSAKPDTERKRLVRQLAMYLTSEGLANLYCSPQLIGISSVAHDAADALSEKCARYQSEFRDLFASAAEVLRCGTDASLNPATCREKLRRLTFDPDGVLPPGHYLSGKLVEQMERSPKIRREEIVALCAEPTRFFSLYNRDPIDEQLTFPAEWVNTAEEVS